MKSLILSLALILPLAAETPPVSEIKVSMEVPSPAWKLKVESVHKKDGKLLVVTRTKKSDGIFTQQVTEVSDTVKLPQDLADMPREIYLVDATWTTSEANKDIKVVTQDELDEKLAGSTNVYQAKKEITADDFLELELTKAEELAKDNKLPYRVVDVDGKPRPVTLDLRMDRFNFHVKDGKVIKVTKG
jgi:hypothetical protein